MFWVERALKKHFWHASKLLLDELGPATYLLILTYVYHMHNLSTKVNSKNRLFAASTALFVFIHLFLTFEDGPMINSIALSAINDCYKG